VTDPARSPGLIRFAAAAAVVLALSGCTSDPPAPDPSPSTTATAGPEVNLDVESGRSDTVRDPVYPEYGNPALDVMAYRLALAWDPDSRELSGVATLTVRAITPVSSVQLDFSDSYTVDDVTVDGAVVKSSWQGDDIAVPKDLAANARTTLVVQYHGRPTPVPMPSERGDFDEGIGLRVTRGGEAWTMQEPYGASTWYPANDTPSDEAVYDVAVTVPTGWSAIAHGKFVGVSNSPDGETFRWLSIDPVASYLATLALGRYTKHEDVGPGGLPITYWIRTDRDEDFLPALKRSPEMLEWLTDRYGPYPFPSAGVVLVDSESAMETQQMVTFGAERGGGAADIDGTTETLLHEYAHQWFGNSVTPKDWTGLWLNEGWAMYTEMLWTIDEGYLTDAEWVTWARAADTASRPVAGPPGHPDPDHFAEIIVYVGPAMMLRAIHKAVGDEAFYALGRDWVQKHRNTQVDRAHFTTFVNDHTGRDFTALINSWLDSPTTPPA
jgi:aminopeptidase N